MIGVNTRNMYSCLQNKLNTAASCRKIIKFNEGYVILNCLCSSQIFEVLYIIKCLSNHYACIINPAQLSINLISRCKQTDVSTRSQQAATYDILTLNRGVKNRNYPVCSAGCLPFAVSSSVQVTCLASPRVLSRVLVPPSHPSSQKTL